METPTAHCHEAVVRVRSMAQCYPRPQELERFKENCGQNEAPPSPPQEERAGERRPFGQLPCGYSFHEIALAGSRHDDPQGSRLDGEGGGKFADIFAIQLQQDPGGAGEGEGGGAKLAGAAELVQPPRQQAGQRR